MSYNYQTIQPLFKQIITVLILLFLPTSAICIKKISIHTKEITPGSVLIVTMDSANPGNTLNVKLFHIQDQSTQKKHIASFSVADVISKIKSSGCDLDGEPQKVKLHLEIPYYLDKDLFGTWMINVSDSDGSSQNTTFNIFHSDNLVGIFTNWINKKIDEFIPILRGLRGDETFSWKLCIIKKEDKSWHLLNDINFENYRQPSWSFDKEIIAVSALTHDKWWHIHIVDLRRVSVKTITKTKQNSWSPIWNHDGKKLAFIRAGSLLIFNTIKNKAIIKKNPDLDSLFINRILNWNKKDEFILEIIKGVTDNSLSNNATSNGTHHKDYLIREKILQKDKRYYKLDIKTNILTLLLFQPIYEWLPGLSFVHNEIAFDCKINGQHDIWIMKKTGDEPINLTYLDNQGKNADWIDKDPAWSVDGKRIIFVTNRRDKY